MVAGVRPQFTAASVRHVYRLALRELRAQVDEAGYIIYPPLSKWSREELVIEWLRLYGHVEAGQEYDRNEYRGGQGPDAKPFPPRKARYSR